MVVWIYKYKKQKAAIQKNNHERVNELLSTNEPIYLEFGAGTRKLDGWVSVDIEENNDIIIDLSEPIIFPDNSVAKIYSSHFLEHFHYDELIQLLRECYRVLIKGGTFSAAVPNAQIYIEAYLNPTKINPELFCKYKPGYHHNSKIDYINYIAYMGGHHKYMFDNENIISILEKTGFENVKTREYDFAIDNPERDYESLYVICRK